MLELAHIEMLAQVDDLVERLSEWAANDSPWQPLNYSRSLIRRVLSRVETLRIRLEAPLVVATFGGTGTGKSALVNALVGRDCTESGRQRPTTTRPVLIVHPRIELDSLGLPLEEFEVVRSDAEVLRDIVIIDCPDPDTTEDETTGSNLHRLHQLLPHCDVLIYTSTQQKYRSARVVEELAQAATGCRLIFVQTFADLDEDIRDDWRQQLAAHYEVPDVFFVDSLRALREQQAGLRPTGDFSRLMDLLSVQLAASHRTQIRRANLLDLIQSVVDRCRDDLSAHWPHLSQLEAALEEQRQKLLTTMTGQLRRELLGSSQLWERRLVGAVVEEWGMSPFSAILRLYSSLGGVLASTALFRARSSAQIALIGAVQGVRWLSSKSEEQASEQRLKNLAVLGLDDGVLREAQVIVAGYTQSAELDPRLADAGTLDALRHEAVIVEDRFLSEAGRRIDEIIAQLAHRHSGFVVRVIYEVCFTAFLVYLLVRIGKNFFWDSVMSSTEIMTLSFYVPALIFLLLWGGTLVALFTRGLRRGLTERVHELAQEMATGKIEGGLFPQLDLACREIRFQRDRLEALSQSTASIRRQIATDSALGAKVREEERIKAKG